MPRTQYCRVKQVFKNQILTVKTLTLVILPLKSSSTAVSGHVCLTWNYFQIWTNLHTEKMEHINVGFTYHLYGDEYDWSEECYEERVYINRISCCPSFCSFVSVLTCACTLQIWRSREA